MAKTEATKILENRLHDTVIKRGTFGAFEVTIGWNGNERVDFLTYSSTGEFRCYEIKVSVSDFHSKNHNSFVGNYNYYVMPTELYKKVKDEIPDFVGVYVGQEFLNKPFVDKGKTYWRDLECIKKAKRKALIIDKDVLFSSLCRCLQRDAEKYYNLEDNLTNIEEMKKWYDREISSLIAENREVNRKYGSLQINLHNVFGREGVNKVYEAGVLRLEDEEQMEKSNIGKYRYCVMLKPERLRAILLGHLTLNPIFGTIRSVEVYDGETYPSQSSTNSFYATYTDMARVTHIITNNELQDILSKVFGRKTNNYVERIVPPQNKNDEYILIFKY